MSIKKVLIPQDITDPGKQYLLDRGYQLEYSPTYQEDDIAKSIQDCDALLIRTAKVSRKVMEAGSKLKVIARHGVGVDNIDLSVAEELGITVTNSPLSNYDAVAEHTIALILACGHQLCQMDSHARNGGWEQRNAVKLTQAMGKTLGIVGYGRIGAAVAQKAALGLNMKVLAYSRSIASLDLPDYVTAVSSPEEIYANSDYISLHLPATPHTKESINLSVFQQMKDTAFLINTARGEVIHEGDLATALTTGLIQGAGLDVLADEPPVENNPLLGLKNVIITPHCAALTLDAFDKMGLHAAQGIHEVLSGQAVTWQVVPSPS